MEAEASRPVSHCVYLAVQGRSGEASGPGQVGRSGRYPAGEWVWLRVGLEARARGNTGAGEGRAQDALEDSWPSVWHNGTGREGGRPLLRFTVGGAEPDWPQCRRHRGLSGEGSSGVAHEGLWSVGPQG